MSKNLEVDEFFERIRRLHSTTYVGFVLIIYLAITMMNAKIRIDSDSKTRAATHKFLLKESSWDYVSSILWMEYSFKDRENQAVANEIDNDIKYYYGDNTDKLQSDFDMALVGGKSPISTIIRKNIDFYKDKIVLFRHGSELQILDNCALNQPFNLYDTLNGGEMVYNQIAKNILNNMSPTFENFNSFIYKKDGNTIQQTEIDSIKSRFLSGDYNLTDMDGNLFSVSYIYWKKGLFGESITSKGLINNDVRQLIVLSTINMSEALTKQPAVVKHTGNFNRNGRVVDETFNNNDRYNISIMYGNMIMIIIIGLTFLIQRDIKSAKILSRRRKNDDFTLDNH